MTRAVSLNKVKDPVFVWICDNHEASTYRLVWNEKHYFGNAPCTHVDYTNDHVFCVEVEVDGAVFEWSITEQFSIFLFLAVFLPVPVHE